MKMLSRFSLYGFLENQQYYDPFMVLAFLQMGLNYTLIGTLIAFREIAINIMEVPSGALADLYGRRKCMIFSFIAYLISFNIMGAAGLFAIHMKPGIGTTLSFLFAGMLFFAVGETFRTGTHKAMIFAWLRNRDRTAEKTKIYGYTRSWSKVGSAVSVLLAGLFVFLTDNFIYVFFFSAIPCLLNIVNLAAYPAEVDGEIKQKTSIKEVIHHLQEAIGATMKRRDLRRLVAESMGFEGFFKATKDYVQPVLMAAAIPLSASLFRGVELTEEKSSIILIVPVYFILFMLSALASRKSHVLVERHGHEDRTARILWGVLAATLVTMLPAMYFGLRWLMITGFVAMYVIQNLWRPVLISRFDSHSSHTHGATILSIENQAKSLATMIIAPSLGLAIDLCARHGIGTTPFWPLAALGTILATGFMVTGKAGHRSNPVTR